MEGASNSGNSGDGSHDSQKTKSRWRRMFGGEGKDWQREFKAEAIIAERLKHDLDEIREDLREKAASLHRGRQSSFYDAIRNLDDPKPMAKELLDKYDAALEKVKRLQDNCNNERQQRFDMQKQLRQEYEELDRRWRSNENDLERKHLIGLKQEYTKGQKDEHDQWTVRLANVEFQHKIEIGNSETRIRELEAYCHDLNFLNGEVEAERDTLRVEKEALERDNEEADKKHLSEVKELEVSYCEKLSTVEQDLEDEKQRHVGEIRDLNQKHSDDMRRRQTEHEGQIKIWQNKIAELKTTHQSNLETQQEEYDITVGRLKQEHRAEEEQLRQMISNLKQGHATELQRCEKWHNQEVSKLKSNFKEIMSQKQAAHASAEKSLREEIAAYSGALLARDKNDFNMVERDVLKPMPDTEIEGRFVDLAQDVDRLSRLEWKPNPKGWTTQILRSLSSNQRLFKKQILQDIIWVILHKFIFCSPFRIFGEEGQALESQWNKECGTDNSLDNGVFIWPKPRMETERWRYVTIRECRAALRQPVPSQWDPRAKLKKGFQTTIEELKEEMTSTLGELVTLDKNSIQSLEKMVMKAARTWLEFGLQHCRIVVVVQGSNLNTAGEKVQKAQQDGLELVMVPELKRFGTSKGENLNTVETIRERDAETVKVVMERRAESKAERGSG